MDYVYSVVVVGAVACCAVALIGHFVSEALAQRARHGMSFFFGLALLCVASYMWLEGGITLVRRGSSHLWLARAESPTYFWVLLFAGGSIGCILVAREIWRVRAKIQARSQACPKAVAKEPERGV
jgi:hypothetical protein